jgi:hypothetical protein
MIIARFCLPGGEILFHGSVEIQGSPAGDDYRQGGWFPVESFHYGFERPEEKSKDDKPKSGPTGATGSPGRSGGNAPAQPTEKKEDQKKAEMTIAKEVDRATCDLMALAMEERSKKKGADRGSAGGKELHVDIHILASVRFGSNLQENYIFPSVMIHLEGVGVKSWSIDGSGDNRPSESVTLKYDRGAMHYSWYDGQTFLHFGPKGWDQDKNQPWPASETDPAFKKYRPQVK